MAPGASLVGLDVFGTFEDTTESNFLQAINYAVETDHVNVINESFGSNPFPDVTAARRDQAVRRRGRRGRRRGHRLDRRRGLDQHDRLAGHRPERHLGRRVDAVPVLRADQLRGGALLRDHRLAERQHQLAQLRRVRRDRRHGRPGRARRPELRVLRREPDFSRAASTSRASPPTIEESGGTSESAPFVAGAAALVIQAYRKTHGGATPTPALVKQILVSTATDLGAPATEQGAGLLNSYKAVELAESITRRRSRRRQHAAAVDQPAERRRRARQHATAGRSPITNTGARSQVVHLTGRTFGPDENVQTGSVTLNDATSPQFANYQGLQNNYGVFHFHVHARPGPAGRVDRLPGRTRPTATTRGCG